MDKRIQERAKLAARSTTIDTMLGLGSMLDRPECSVHPSAFNLLTGSPTKDCVIARVPDLLDLAFYAWYRLQEEDK